METWIHDAILDGLSRLLCLGLDRTPAADMIAGTAAAWAEAITTGRTFDAARDRSRFRSAFVTALGGYLAMPVWQDADLRNDKMVEAFGTPSREGTGGLFGRLMAQDLAAVIAGEMRRVMVASGG